MRIELELFSHGMTHAARIYHHDDTLSSMVRGFRCRAFGVYFCVVWRVAG